MPDKITMSDKKIYEKPQVTELSATTTEGKTPNQMESMNKGSGS
jgi:hypothetical protein